MRTGGPGPPDQIVLLIWTPEFRYMPGICRIYHVYVDLHDIHGYTWYILGYTMYIHVIGYTMYIDGYTMYIPDILVTFQYVRDIHGIYQAYTENLGSR
jgi:hypothetical protein